MTDRIIALDHGEIVFNGTYEQLIENIDLYKALGLEDPKPLELEEKETEI
jgi:ABC-type multidrug transport system ATPase subunit